MAEHVCKKRIIQGATQRVLLIVYDLKYSGGSESGAGASALRAHNHIGNQLLVLTRSQSETMEFQSENPNFKFHKIDVPKFFVHLARVIPFEEQFIYLVWNVVANIEMRKLILTNKFDYIHHATYSGDWNPCQAIYLRGQKIVWGPIGGAQQIPFRHFHNLGFRGAVKQVLYLAITIPMRQFNRLVASYNNVTVLAVNNSTKLFFEKKKEVLTRNDLTLI